MVLSRAQGEKKRRKRKKAGMIEHREKRKLKRRKVSPCYKVSYTSMTVGTLEWEEDYPVTTTTSLTVQL